MRYLLDPKGNFKRSLPIKLTKKNFYEIKKLVVDITKKIFLKKISSFASNFAIFIGMGEI